MFFEVPSSEKLLKTLKQFRAGGFRMEHLGKSLLDWCHTTAYFWGGVWGGFLEKMLPNREKTTPKPTPPFWCSACNHNSSGRFRAIAKPLSPAFHAGNRGSLKNRE